MSNRKITHEVKLQKSVIIILGVLAVGVMANAFAPAFNVKDALAESLSGNIMVKHWFPDHTLFIECRGCN